MWHLRCAVQDELLGLPLPDGDDTLAFQRRDTLACSTDAARNLDGRSCDILLERAPHLGFEEDVVAPMLMHARRVGLRCSEHIDIRP